jgi:hypothetical protein
MVREFDHRDQDLSRFLAHFGNGRRHYFMARRARKTWPTCSSHAAESKSNHLSNKGQTYVELFMAQEFRTFYSNLTAAEATLRSPTS